MIDAEMQRQRGVRIKDCRIKVVRRSQEERDALVLQWQYLPQWGVNESLRDPRLQSRVRGLGLDDAQQVGFLALLRAAELFDETRGIKFVTYAGDAIKLEINKAAMGNNAVHVPNYMLFGRRKEKFADAAARARQPLASLKDIVPGRPAECPMEGQEETDRCLEALETLPNERTRTVLRLRFLEGQTLLTVAERLGLTKERIRQLQKEGLAELKAMLNVA